MARVGKLGRFRFNTVPRVPSSSRRKRRNTSISKFQRNSGAGSIHAFARYSDILRENYLPGLGSPVSNLSHLRTSCSHIIHHFRKKSNTFPIFFLMNFPTKTSPFLCFMHNPALPRPFSRFYGLRKPAPTPPPRISSQYSHIKYMVQKLKFTKKILVWLQVVHNLGV